jgi:hypothetical protein
MAFDRDDDRGADQKQKLGGLQADNFDIAQRQGGQHPNGDHRHGGQQQHIDGFAVGLLSRDKRAGKIDQIGDEPRHDHHFDAGKDARCPQQARKPEVEDIAEKDRHRRVGAILESIIRRRQRPERVVAPNRHEIKRHQRQIDQSQAGFRPHHSLPNSKASARHRAHAVAAGELARSWRPSQQ